MEEVAGGGEGEASRWRGRGWERVSQVAGVGRRGKGGHRGRPGAEGSDRSWHRGGIFNHGRTNNCVDLVTVYLYLWLY